MKLDRIAFEQVFPIGVYSTRRFRAEAVVTEGEDIISCYNELHRIIMEAQESIGIGIPSDTHHADTAIDSKIKAFIDTINMCNDVAFLENFRKRVEEENNDALTNAFNRRLHELSVGV
jgi:hypothetical protein